MVPGKNRCELIPFRDSGIGAVDLQLLFDRVHRCCFTGVSCHEAWPDYVASGDAGIPDSILPRFARSKVRFG